MGLFEDFDDRHISFEAEKQEYKPYEYQTENNDSWAGALPVKQGLYDPSYEKDACGVGFAWYVAARNTTLEPPLTMTLTDRRDSAATSRASRATKSSAMLATSCAT